MDFAQNEKINKNTKKLKNIKIKSEIQSRTLMQFV